MKKEAMDSGGALVPWTGPVGHCVQCCAYSFWCLLLSTVRKKGEGGKERGGGEEKEGERRRR
jgi:hypothetical protein